MTRRLILAPLAILLLTQCVAIQRRIDRTWNGPNPYVEAPFYMKYTNTGTTVDDQIVATVKALLEDPHSPVLHNHLGMMLSAKGFPKDAELEFRRAIADDSRFYPAWYNLALMRAARGNERSAVWALRRTLQLKPGHAAALFQIGLIEEKQGKYEAAVAHYAKAFRINRNLLDVRVNPQILDSRLVTRSLIELYPIEHEELSLNFNPAPPGYSRPGLQSEPTPQATPEEIVTPSPSVTEPAMQTPPPSVAPPPEPENAPNPAPATPPQSVPMQSVQPQPAPPNPPNP